MDGARSAGVPVAVCSAATKSAVEYVLGNLLGRERFEGLDLFMAGDDVREKKPDPTIYKVGMLLWPGAMNGC
jgi:beta-phosphoglucomutase-like phosphatase (HAD superfamily)